MKQEPPFCIQVELSEGCNLYCDFCGLTGIREKSKKNYKFMSLRNANKIAASIAEEGWNSRIEFAMHGEPTMNPDFTQIIAAFRHHLPNNQLMMTSNGGGLLGDSQNKIDALFRAGLNILALDNYEYVNIVPKIVEKLSGHTIYQYPDNKDKSPHSRHNENFILVVQDISKAVEGTHSTISNHSGAAGALTDSKMGKRCAKPFREMSIRYNGSVCVCCQDWFDVMELGNVLNVGVEGCWNNELAEAVRKKLYHGQRDFPPCLGCNYTTYRNGLLPDQRGHLEMPKPTKKDEEIISNNLHPPRNKPVSQVAKESTVFWRKNYDK